MNEYYEVTPEAYKAMVDYLKQRPWTEVHHILDKVKISEAQTEAERKLEELLPTICDHTKKLIPDTYNTVIKQ